MIRDITISYREVARDRYGKFVYALSLSLLLFSYCMGQLEIVRMEGNLSKFLLFINLFSAALMVVKILLFTDYKANDIPLIFFIVLLLLPYTLIEKNINSALLILFLIGSYHIPVDNILKIYLYVYSLLFTVIALLASLRVIPSPHDITRLQSDGNLKVRETLGFYFPNITAIFLFIIVFCLFCLGSLRFLTFAAIGLLVFSITYWYIDSRTAAYLIVLMVVLYPFVKSLSHTAALIISVSLSALTVVASFLLPTLYGNSKIMLFLDKILSKRLFYSKMFLEKYSITPFGQHVTTYNGQQVEQLHGRVQSQILDNSFVQLAIVYGILYCLAIIFIIALIFKKADDAQQKYMIIGIMIMFLEGFSENTFINIQRNPLLLMSFALFISENYRQHLRDNKGMKMDYPNT